MAKLIIEINLDNACFDRDPRFEIKRILLKFVSNFNYLTPRSDGFPIFDMDGNKVGQCRTIGKRRQNHD